MYQIHVHGKVQRLQLICNNVLRRSKSLLKYFKVNLGCFKLKTDLLKILSHPILFRNVHNVIFYGHFNSTQVSHGIVYADRR